MGHKPQYKFKTKNKMYAHLPNGYFNRDLIGPAYPRGLELDPLVSQPHACSSLHINGVTCACNLGTSSYLDYLSYSIH